MTYALGSIVTISTTVTNNAGVFVDAGTIVLSILKPDGTQDTPSVAHDSTGHYHADYTPAAGGHYAYRWVTTGTGAGAIEGEFEVSSAFTPELVSLADIKTHLNYPAGVTTDDTELQGFIDAAADVIRHYTGDVIQQSYTDVVQTTNVPAVVRALPPRSIFQTGYPQVLLSHYPIRSVTSVTVSELDGTVPVVLASSSYLLDSDAGTITVVDGSNFGPLVTAVYTAGLAKVPGAVRLAALELVAYWWHQTQQVSMGVAGGGPIGTADFDTVTPGLLYPRVPDNILAILGPYRRAPAVA